MKVLLSDFDGTLVGNNDVFSIHNKEKMQELIDKGHIMVICTGRNLQEFLKDQEKYQFPFNYLILNNGGYIVDHHYRTLFEKTIPHEAGVNILNYTTAIQDMWSYYGNGKETYAYKNGVTYNHAGDGRVLESFDFNEAYHRAGDFQILCFHQDNQKMDHTQKCFDYVQKHFGHVVEAYFNLHYVDIVPKGCSKGEGMNQLLRMLEDVDEVYAIGDSYNDLSMLTHADFGYTLKSANDDIKNQVKYHVNYVYEVIDDMLGGK